MTELRHGAFDLVEPMQVPATLTMRRSREAQIELAPPLLRRDWRHMLDVVLAPPKIRIHPWFAAPDSSVNDSIVLCQTTGEADQKPPHTKQRLC